MNQVLPTYSLRNLNSKSAEQKFLEALSVYNKVTNITSKTDSDQIAYWRLRYNKENSPNRLFVFSLEKDDKVVGFAMAMHIDKIRCLIIDHIAISPDSLTNSLFFAFVEMIREEVHSEVSDFNFMAVEVMDDPGEQQLQISYEKFLQTYRVAGFKLVHFDHYIPNLNAREYSVKLKARLLLCPFGDIHEIKKEVLKSIVNGLVFEHYGRWYAPFVIEHTDEYKVHLMTVYSDFEKQVADSENIELNGAKTGFPINPEAEAGIRKAPYKFLIFSSVVIAFGFVFILLASTKFGIRLELSLLVLFSWTAVYFAICAMLWPKTQEISDRLFQLVKGLFLAKH